MNRVDKKMIIEKIAKYCDRCGKRYSINDIELVKSVDNARMYLLRCHNCGATHLVTLTLGSNTGNRFVMNTDILPNEAKHLDLGVAITYDDAIDVHTMLERFKSLTMGNLFKLIATSREGFLSQKSGYHNKLLKKKSLE